MKTRNDFIQYCCYPFLPAKSFSVSYLYHFNHKTHLTKHWLGGRITGEVKANNFSLSAQSHKVNCFVSENDRLFFDFNKNAKSLTWKEVFSFLREGDHLLVQLSSDEFKNKTQSASLYEISNIEKIVLVSVNKTEKMLSSSTAVVQKQQSWFDFLDEVHKGMRELGLKRVATPTLVDCPGTEPDLDFFETELYFSTEARKKKMFLISSPEIYMKRLLCCGWTDLYEVKKCFRNKEAGLLNYSEFYMLEWYRAYSHLPILIEDLQFFLNYLSNKITGSSFPKLKKISMKELFKQKVGMELHPSSAKEDFIRELKNKNIPFEESGDIEDLFYLLFLNEIEPHLDQKTPLVIYDYPPFQKAYARIGPEGWASRFELFWKGMELANAFDEVITKEEQNSRFEEDIRKRHEQEKQKVPSSHKLLDDMQAGMPPCSGIALGLDRLFLAFKGLKSIDQIRLFV
ncbi:MAG: hypothetical protein OXM55_04970 [Bdellovibrionales bacterium]|nr:hypothetical protein [Bdellovibrionales bacterium]